ncbi:MAG TPA: hypothetical protein VHW00_06065 [Thermoanaerobaculia bacterium]|nr:hypothetical protein [Thermoanaerobaculia bacterium]
MQEQQLRKTPGQSDSFFPSIHEGDDPETRYRTRRRDDDTRFRIEALPDVLASAVEDRSVGITVNDPSIRSIEWSLTKPDGRVVPSKVRTKAGDRDATTRAFPLRKKDLTMTGSYMLSCVGYNASGTLQLVAFRDFRVVASNDAVFSATEGQFAFFEYEVKDGGVRVQLAFVPNAKVTCPDIGWMQAVQAVDSEGESIYRYTSNVEGDARKTPLQWTIDRKDGAPSPFYGFTKDAAGALVPDDRQTKRGGVGQADPGAILKDFPTIQPSMVAKFETCAVCRSGADAGRVFGCAMWGFTVQDDSSVTLHPRSFAMKPSPKFTAAATKWNEWNEGLASKRENAPRLRTP